MGSLVWKLVTIGVGVAATKTAAAISENGWKKATGKPAPGGKYDPKVTPMEAAIYALVAAAVGQGVRAFAETKAVNYYTKTAGHPPKAIQKQQQKALEEREKKAKKKAAKLA